MQCKCLDLWRFSAAGITSDQYLSECTVCVLSDELHSAAELFVIGFILCHLLCLC